MPARALTGLTAGAFVLLSLGAVARSEDRLALGIAGLVAPRIERGDGVGTVVGVVREGRSEVFGFGRVSADVDRAPDGRTIFEIGSMTKAFTSLALADMAREGIVRLDDPVATLLPEDVRVPDRDGRAITLRTLANHSSGLPRVMPQALSGMLASGDPYAKIMADDVFAFLKTANLSNAPGEKFSYSNIGPSLLGMAVTRRAGTPYEDLIVARICRPLKLADTRAVLDAAQSSRQAKPYMRAGKPTVYWHFDALAGAGALRSTADDELAFARANLGLAEVPDRLREAMRDMRTPTAEIGRGGQKVGLAWLIIPARNGPDRPETFVHNGGTGGFRSYLAIAPAAKAAVIVLSNSASEVDSIGDTALGLLVESRGAGRGPE
jgi:D-alanyl-D-alanine-carboxypeptidase/D-alanyl-D-alanine-endopeptidase